MYVIQTKTGFELASSKIIEKMGYKAKVPEKIMLIRHGGSFKKQKYLIFKNYIFLDENKITPKDYYHIKIISGVINFIGGGTPIAMTEQERQYILWLWNCGNPIEPSKVFVSSDGAKMIMSGILQNYNGKYINFNIRQRRAKIKIPICGVDRNITVPIEILN